MKNNFKCPETEEEIFVARYRVVSRGGRTLHIDKSTGKEIVSSDGTPMEPIEKEGYPTVVYGDTNQRIANRQKFFKSRAKKHSESLDQKLRKQDRTKEELTRFKKKK